jgi:hypothetical protein
MPFGKHWEWRGFGQTSPRFTAWFRSLPPLYDDADARGLTRDDYLWTPGCRHNVKLRDDALKFKRFLARRGPFEQWLEDAGEFLPFPIAPTHVGTLATLLDVQLPETPTAPLDREALLRLLHRAQPPVQRVTVLKQRRLRRWRFAEGVDLVVEWTHIHVPQDVETVALECESLEELTRAYARLRPWLHEMRAMNYLQAIALWLKASEA